MKENEMKDSDMIFTAITEAGVKNIDDARRIICAGYVADSSISRGGISHALKRLEKYYEDKQT